MIGLKDKTFTVRTHGIGMAGFSGMCTWSANLEITSSSAFKSEAEAMEHFSKFAKKHALKWKVKNEFDPVNLVDDDKEFNMKKKPKRPRC